MTAFFNRHSDKIKGVFSCIDRLIIQGTIPEICFPGAITTFFYLHGIKIFDFKKWAAPMRDQINENAKQIAQKNNIEKDQKTLAPIYEELVGTLSHAVKPNNIAMFLGNDLTPDLKENWGNSFPRV